MTTFNSLSIDRLCENFSSAVTQSQVILNNNLQPITGRFSSCSHNKIFASTLQFLQATTAESISHQTLLIWLRDMIHGYVKKAEMAAAIALKTKKNPQPIDPSIIDKILVRIKELHTQVSEHETSTPVSRTEIEALQPLTEDGQLNLRQSILGMISEWYVFKALELTSTVISSTLQLRAELLTLGYRLSNDGEPFTICPPLSHFESPWPILLLGYRLEKAKEGEPLYQKAISRIMKAREIYPKHEEILKGFLLCTRYGETHQAAITMIKECTTTLAMIRERVPRSSWGTAIEILIEALDTMRPKSSELCHRKEAFRSTAFQTKDLQFEAGERLEKDDAELLEDMRVIVSRGCAAFDETLPDFSETYQSALSKLKNVKQNSAHQREEMMKFSSTLHFPIFSPKGVFSPYIAPLLPPDGNTLRSTKFHFTPSIDDAHRQGQPKESGSSDSIRQAQSDFLPKNVFRPPAPRKPVASHKKKHSSPGASVRQPSIHSTPPSPSISPPTEEMAHLSIRQEEPYSSFSFRVGDHADPRLQFAMHVRRWKIPDFDPFRFDTHYKDRHFSREVQEAIRFQHTPPLALVKVILDYGEKYVHADTVRESYYLPAEATWYDGTRRYEKGVITIGRNRLSCEIFHYSFSQQAPSTLRQNYSQNLFFPCREEEECVEPRTEKVDQRKTLADDGSVIHHIDDTGIGYVDVTVDDPLRKVRVDVFIEG